MVDLGVYWLRRKAAAAVAVVISPWEVSVMESPSSAKDSVTRKDTAKNVI